MLLTAYWHSNNNTGTTIRFDAGLLCYGTNHSRPGLRGQPFPCSAPNHHECPWGETRIHQGTRSQMPLRTVVTGHSTLLTGCLLLAKKKWHQMLAQRYRTETLRHQTSLGFSPLFSGCHHGANGLNAKAPMMVATHGAAKASPANDRKSDADMYIGDALHGCPRPARWSYTVSIRSAS